MNIRFKAALIFTVILLPIGVAMPHHAFAPVYDINSMVSFQGTVTEFKLVNPHSSMKVDSVDTDGGTTTWTVDFDGRVNLASAGWTDDKFQIGEVVTVSGNLAHSGEPKVFFVKLVRADGSEVLRPFLDRFQSIDEQRRLRREQKTEETTD